MPSETADNHFDAASVGAGFDESASDYDALLLYNRQGAHRLVSALPDGTYDRVVDVACGTGFASLAMNALHGTSFVTGIDASREMLDVFRANADAVDGLTVDLQVGDALALPVDDASADCAISTMAFHWYTDKQQALNEMARAVRPGGIVAVLGAGRGTDAELLEVMRGMDPPVPVAWTAVFDYAHRDVGEMHELLEAAGLEAVDVWSETRRRWITPEDYMRRLQAVAAHLSSNMPAEEAEGHAMRLLDELRAAAGERGFAYTFVKLFAIARRPSSDAAASGGPGR